MLTRTNAHAIAHVLAELEAGGRPASSVGGAEDVVAFARAAERLMAGRPAHHHALACFESWEQVRDFVGSASVDEVGEMAMLVRLVEEFGARKLGAALGSCVDEKSATVVVSTAHKSKGREWPIVRIGSDFAGIDEMKSAEELRLGYVAVTRAIERLDITEMGGDEASRALSRRRPQRQTARVALPPVSPQHLDHRGNRCPQRPLSRPACPGDRPGGAIRQRRQTADRVRRRPRCRRCSRGGGGGGDGGGGAAEGRLWCASPSPHLQHDTWGFW